MNYGNVLKRALALAWRYRALWLFGAILALTTVNGFYFGYDFDRDETGRGVAIKVNEDSTIYLPGEGLSIDLTDPDGPSVTVDGRELHGLESVHLGVIAQGVWAILIAVGVVLVGMIVVGTIARYVAETALIRMVNETEETGQKLGIRRGLRLGWSRSAWRLFLIDLLIHLPVTVVIVLLFVLALVPLLLWISGSTAAGVLGTLFTVGLFFLVLALSLVVNLALSLVVHVMRRACALEGLGVIASIRRGLALVKGNLKEVGVVWLFWIGMRLVWMFSLVPVMILIFPITLLFIVAGAVFGGLPAAALGGLLTPFLQGPFPWIVGGVVGLPIFMLVMIAPMLFLGGLVEVLKSSTWTLAYRELRAAESAERQASPATDAPGLQTALVV
jgi:hypothetical protein